jgi:hypothetical protein
MGAYMYSCACVPLIVLCLLILILSDVKDDKLANVGDRMQLLCQEEAGAEFRCMHRG